MQNFRYSEAGMALTKRYEGLRLKAYQDSGGVWTVGYGHTGADVTHDRCISSLEAEALLRADLRWALVCVNGALTRVVLQNQFDALVDFCFNVGRGNFIRSTLLKQVNLGNLAEAVPEFGRWMLVQGQPCPGLQRRRSAEAAMFQGTYRANSLA